ncbi:MAG: phosphodiester glycosidase family protein [Rubrobacteraceae bacterium]
MAGLAWIDTPLVQLVLIPGLTEPVPKAGSGEVLPHSRKGLLATFNSGFKNVDGHGGFISNGHTYVSPKPGLGTIAVYRSGKVAIGSWEREIQPSSHITYLRQNLPLIVDHGRPNPATNNSYLWGTTVGNAVRVWRSGIGIDAHGGLIYAAGDGVTARGLADLLARAGAIRGMELDINSYWVNLFTYGAPGGGAPSKLLSTMTRSKYRYLSPDERDFFALFSNDTKTHTGAQYKKKT